MKIICNTKINYHIHTATSAEEQHVPLNDFIYLTELEKPKDIKKYLKIN